MRWLLGLAAVGFGAAGAVAWQSGDTTLGGVFVRVGLVLGALWVGMPAFQRFDRRAVWATVPALAVVMARPRAALVVLPVLVWFLRTSPDVERPEH